MSQDEYRRQVDARAAQVLEAIHERGRYSMWMASALLCRDEDPAEVVEIVENGLLEDAGPFPIFSAGLLLARWEPRLPAAAVERIHRVFTTGQLQRGNTENHWLMY